MSQNTDYNVDSLLLNNNGLYGNPRFANVGNLQQGGQLGPGNRIIQMDGATPLVLNSAHVFVLQMPRFWDRFPKLQQNYKSTIELHAKSIDGIDIGYTEEFDDTQIGHDGQSASMPLHTKRNPINPSVTVDDNYGNLFWNMNYLWLKHINHPDTCASLLSALYGDAMEPWVWSTFSASWIAIQPDPTGLSDRLVEACVMTNIIPTETGNLGMKRTIGSSELAKRTISYKAVMTHNESTRELGRLIMKAISAHKPNWDYALTYNDVAGNIVNYGAQGLINEAVSRGMVKEATDDMGITSDSDNSITNG